MMKIIKQLIKHQQQKGFMKHPDNYKHINITKAKCGIALTTKALIFLLSDNVSHNPQRRTTHIFTNSLNVN